MKQAELEQLVSDLEFHVPPEEQGQPCDGGYAYWQDHGIIERRYDWDEDSFRRIHNRRTEYTLYADPEAESDADFEPGMVSRPWAIR